MFQNVSARNEQILNNNKSTQYSVIQQPGKWIITLYKAQIL